MVAYGRWQLRVQAPPVKFRGRELGQDRYRGAAAGGRCDDVPMLAPIGIMRALHRHDQPEPTPRKKREKKNRIIRRALRLFGSGPRDIRD